MSPAFTGFTLISGSTIADLRAVGKRSLAPNRRKGLSLERTAVDVNPVRIRYSGTAVPEPPSSAGKSFNFGKPSFIRSTVSE